MHTSLLSVYRHSSSLMHLSIPCSNAGSRVLEVLIHRLVQPFALAIVSILQLFRRARFNPSLRANIKMTGLYGHFCYLTRY